ncbi:hypothetical protein HNR42_001184 [Deinobacterium chartae]|uniref:Uncharacterized protein n=1 Tax=Deinobacterium chartae TaxID=521158 RepID=A0A841HWK3_9DEIO|nr:hypothetical protein [Deinobacterium chartae]MBB6097767.1 hypothetical protein [Deinobacterium chartae]
MTTLGVILTVVLLVVIGIAGTAWMVQLINAGDASANHGDDHDHGHSHGHGHHA